MSDLNLFDLSCALAADVYGAGFSLPSAPEDKFSVARLLVDRVTDPIDEQHVVLNIFSVSGKGKSTCAVTIAERCSQLLAERKGRTPDYYFSVDHISDGEPKHTRRIIKKCSEKENPIIIIDEGARDSNSREGMKKENVQNVKLNAIIRHKRMIMIRCVQFESFLDKGIRIQATHELTIVRAEHHKGYNECKFKILVDKGSGTEDPWKVFPTSKDGIVKWARVRIGLPSKELLEQYRELKDKSVNDFIDSYLESMDDDGKKPAKKSRAEITDERAQRAWAYFMDFSHEFVSLSRAAILCDLDPKTLRKWMARQNPPLDESMRSPV